MHKLYSFRRLLKYIVFNRLVFFITFTYLIDIFGSDIKIPICVVPDNVFVDRLAAMNCIYQWSDKTAFYHLEAHTKLLEKGAYHSTLKPNNFVDRFLSCRTISFTRYNRAIYCCILQALLSIYKVGLGTSNVFFSVFWLKHFYRVR